MKEHKAVATWVNKSAFWIHFNNHFDGKIDNLKKTVYTNQILRFLKF